MFSMKKFLTGLLAGSFLALGAGVWTSGAIAQTASDAFDSMGTDDDGASLLNDVSNPFEMIHRAISAPSMSSQEFQQQQLRTIGAEAQNFRVRQQERLREQPALTIEDTDDVTVDREDI